MNKPLPSSGNEPSFFGNLSNRQLITNFDELIRFDEQFCEITKELPVRTGSLFKVGSDSFSAWRIGITDENRQMIKDKADEFHLKDIREKENDSSIENIEATTSSVLMRNSMVRAIVHFATNVLRALDDGKREFKVCDLASGFGQTSVSLAASLYADPQTSDILKRTRFSLVDYSNFKLLRAGQKLDDYHPAAILLTPAKDDAYLAATKERFDIILSLCHLHKKPFIGDTLEAIHEGLAKKGVLISADWHSMMSSTPRFVYQFLERAGVDNRRLKMFRDMFGSLSDPASNPNLNMEEMKAVVDHQEYWASVYQEILSSPSVKGHTSRHYVLGSYDTTSRRMELMEESDLITDPGRIRKAFPGMSLHQNPVRMANGSDRATVMMALRGKTR